MAKFNIGQCPLCDNNSFSDFITCTDYFVSGEKFKIKKCNNCGFKITEDVEDEENIGRYYQSEEYISHSNTSKGLINAIYHRVRNLMLAKKRKLVQTTTGRKSGKILEIGTGTGYFLAYMKKHDWQVSGTEKSKEARNFAKNEFGLEILATENLFTKKEDQFHVITLWHVLEHIHLLNENLERFHKLLKESGKLIIAVPNHSSYDALHYREFWAAWDVPRHIWHFAPKHMKILGEKHGFDLSGVYTMPFDSFYVSLLSERYKKSKMKLFNAFFHGSISWITSVFKPGKCSSVIYVFEKI